MAHVRILAYTPFIVDQAYWTNRSSDSHVRLVRMTIQVRSTTDWSREEFTGNNEVLPNPILPFFTFLPYVVHAPPVEVSFWWIPNYSPPPFWIGLLLFQHMFMRLPIKENNIWYITNIEKKIWDNTKIMFCWSTTHFL